MGKLRAGNNRQTRFGLGVSNCRPTSEVVSAVRTAEGLGAEIAFVAEDVNCRDAFQLLTASALETDRIRLSTGVVNPFTRNPTSLAMAAATLDEISDGRASLGLGTSSPALIEGQMGIPHTGSVRVMREAVEVIKLLLEGGPVSYSGSVYNYDEAELQVRPKQPSVPIFFAAMGSRMLRLAGRMADGVLLNVGASPSYVRWAVSELEIGAGEVGRDPANITVAAWMTAYVSDHLEDSLRRAREWLAVMLSIPRQGELLLEKAGFDLGILDGIREEVRGYPHGGNRTAGGKLVPVEVAHELTLIGTAAEVGARIDEYRRAGVQIPVLGISTLEAVMPGAS
jgi:5,10-methylenetetrahydromethanopterin reductase